MQGLEQYLNRHHFGRSGGGGGEQTCVHCAYTSRTLTQPLGMT